MEKTNNTSELLALYDIAMIHVQPVPRGDMAALFLPKAVSFWKDDPLVFYACSEEKNGVLSAFASSGIGSEPPEVSLEQIKETIETITDPVFAWHRGDESDWPALLGFSAKASAMLIAPLRQDGELLGLACLGRDKKSGTDFSPFDRLLFEVLVQKVLNVLAITRSFEQSCAVLDETKVLYKVSRDLGRVQSFKEIVSAVAAFGELIGMQGLTLQVVTDWDEEGVPLSNMVYSTSDLLHDRTLQLRENVPVNPVALEQLQATSQGLLIYEDTEDLDNRMPDTMRENLRKLGARGALLVRLKAQERWVGFLSFVSQNPIIEFGERSRRLLIDSLAPQVAFALNRLQLASQAGTLLSETEVLYQASAELAAVRTYEEILQVLRTYTLLGDADLNISLNRFDRPWIGDDMPEWTIALSRWSTLPESAVTDRYQLSKFTSAKTLLKPDRAVLIEDIATDSRLDENARYLYQKIYTGGSTIFIPLVVGQQWIGYINAIFSQPRQFPQTLVRQLMSLAGQAAVVIQSAERLGEAERRALQMQTAAEVSRTASSMLNLDELLPQVADLIRARFDLYYAGVFLVDDTGRWAVLRAGTGEAGQKMLAAGHRLEVGGDSMIGACVAQRQARIALDVGAEAVHFENPHLPDTHSELALPLISRGQAIGAMTIQSSQPAAFSEEDITVLQTMADQVANVIANARLFAEAQERLEDMQSLQRQMTAETWATYAHRQDIVGYTYDLSQVAPLETALELSVVPELTRGEIVAQSGGDSARLLAPINLHGAPIGLLSFEEPERIWSEEDLELVTAVRAQLSLALENRLLFEQTRDALAETSNLYETSQHISEAQTVEEIFISTLAGLSLRPEIDFLMAGVFTPFADPQQLDIAHAWSRGGEPLTVSETLSLDVFGSLYQTLVKRGQCIAADVEETLAEKYLDFYQQFNLHGVAAFQLRVRDLPYGMILIGMQDPHDFSKEELRFYETVTHTTAVALENQHLLQTTQKEAERRAFLNEVMSTASAILNPDELLGSVGQLIARRLGMPTMLWRLSPEKQVYPVAIHHADGAEFKFPQDSQRTFNLSDLSGIGAAARLRRSIKWQFNTRPYRSASFQQLITTLQLEEAFSVPLMVRDEVLGILAVGRQVGHAPIDEDVMTFLRGAAVNIGVSLENARLYQNAQDTAEKLKEVDRLKSEFLANMSHELRTPLNSIIGFSRVILKGIDGPLTDLQQTDLLAIYESGRHLLNLINDILDLSKIEAGKMEFAFESTDLHDVVKGVLSTALALVKDKPIELQQVLPESMPSILADERRIRQVLLNIVGNASKFTEKGFIRVSASYDEHDVVIAIQDTGIGIPADKYGAVFQEFQQVDSSSTRSYGGTGLGLPVSKKFVEAHGGRIWFESEVGVGSIFYVSLPIAGPTAVPAEEDVTESVRPERVVLAVDDDESVIKLFQRYLERQGYRVVGITNASEAISEAERLKPYAITLDILMPDQDGWQVIRKLKSNPETRDIPIIVCSILSDANKGLSMGVTDYLIKPVSEQDLLTALGRLAEDEGPNRVLVVDDHPDDRKLLRRILEESGYFVDEAAGGAEAIVKIHDESPDLIVLDLMMPEVDGFTVLENLKSDEVTRQIPVVVVTAKELSSAEREQLYMRAEALLQKGIFDQDQLLEDVETALNRLTSSQEGS